MPRAVVTSLCLLLSAGCASLSPQPPPQSPTAAEPTPAAVPSPDHADPNATIDESASAWRFIPQLRLGIGYSRGDERWSGWGYGLGLGITIVP